MFDTLHADIINIAFQYFSTDNLLSFRGTCKRFHNLIDLYLKKVSTKIPYPLAYAIQTNDRAYLKWLLIKGHKFYEIDFRNIISSDNILIYKFICKYGRPNDRERIEKMSQWKHNHRTKIYKAQLRPLTLKQKIDNIIFVLFFFFLGIVYYPVALIKYIIKKLL